MSSRQALIDKIAVELQDIGSVGFGNASGVGKTAVQMAVMERFPDLTPIYLCFGNEFQCDPVDEHLDTLKPKDCNWLGAWIEAGKLCTRRDQNGVVEVSSLVWKAALRKFVANGGTKLPCNVDKTHIIAIDEAQRLGYRLLSLILEKLHKTDCKIIVTGTFIPEAIFTSGRHLECVPFDPLSEDEFTKAFGFKKDFQIHLKDTTRMY